MSDFKIGGVPIAKMKVTDLKNELDARGLGKTGKKDELVSRLISYMEENGDEIKEATDEAADSKTDQEGKEEEVEKKKLEETKKEKELQEEEKKKKDEKQKLADEEEAKKEKEKEEIKRLADEKADKQKLADEEKAKKEKEKAEKEKSYKEEKGRKEKEKAEKQKQSDDEKAKKEKEKLEKQRLAQEEEKKKKSEEAKEEERIRDLEKTKEEKKTQEEKVRRDEQKNADRKERDEQKMADRKEREELKRKEAQKEKEEQKLKDDKRQKDRQRRFEEDQKAEDERKEKSRAERKSKEDESENKGSVMNGKNGIEDDDESSKKADIEEEALDFEPEAPVDDTLVMEVDQHDLLEEEKEAIIAAEPGEVTSLRKLGGNKSTASSGDRKRGWGSGRGRLASTDMAISSDTLKDLVPDLKPLLSGEAEVGSPTPTVDSDDDVAGPKAPKAANEPHKKRKKIEEDLNETEVVLITNLTRPFTVNQLKEMLKRTGTIVDFWIDRIKSKCCVEFSSSDQASETRMALNGVTWPQGNPKTLRVSFSSKPEMKKMQEGVNEGLMGRLGTETEGRVGVRDWDKNKVDQEREREREREKGRSVREVKERKDSVREKSEEKSAVVTKSLEDLFNKTTAGPAIYWRPLSEEEIEVKIKERNEKIKEAKIQNEEDIQVKIKERNPKINEAKLQKDMMESAEAVLRAKRMGDALGVGGGRSLPSRRSRSSSGSPR